MTIESPEAYMMALFEVLPKDKKPNDVNLIFNVKMEPITLFFRSNESVSKLRTVQVCSLEDTTRMEHFVVTSYLYHNFNRLNHFRRLGSNQLLRQVTMLWH